MWTGASAFALVLPRVLSLFLSLHPHSLPSSPFPEFVISILLMIFSFLLFSGNQETRSHPTHGTSTMKKTWWPLVRRQVQSQSGKTFTKPNHHWNKGKECLGFGLLRNRGPGRNFWSIRKTAPEWSRHYIYRSPKAAQAY